MIFDSLKNKENYRHFPALYQALDYLSSLPGRELPAPHVVLNEDKLFCNLVTFISKPEDECRYEAHRNYIDLHFIVSGIERIATADICSLTSAVPYDPEKDIEFLSGDADGCYELKPDQFMVCFPNDAHKVAMMKGKPADVKKIVFKIKMEDEP